MPRVSTDNVLLPFPGLRIGVTEVQLMLMERGAQLQLWEGEVPETVDI